MSGTNSTNHKVMIQWDNGETLSWEELDTQQQNEMLAVLGAERKLPAYEVLETMTDRELLREIKPSMIRNKPGFDVQSLKEDKLCNEILSKLKEDDSWSFGEDIAQELQIPEKLHEYIIDSSGDETQKGNVLVKTDDDTYRFTIYTIRRILGVRKDIAS